MQQGSTRVTRLRNELYSDSFHAVLDLSSGLAKCQCCTTTVTVVVYKTQVTSFFTSKLFKKIVVPFIMLLLTLEMEFFFGPNGSKINQKHIS